MIYLVRHGQTEFNVAGRWQGQIDSPLTALGREQARRMGATLRRLAAHPDVAMFVSPLGRARETAALIAQAFSGDSEILYDDRLMEVGMGSWDGLTDGEIERGFPHARDGLGRNEWFFHSPDGETYEAMATRVAAALEAARAHRAKTRIIVCHGVTGRLVRGIHAKLGKDAILDLDAPQDALFHLVPDGSVARIDCR